MRIPPQAKRVAESYPLLNVDRWYCGDCEAEGDDKTLDFVAPRDWELMDYEQRQDTRIEYCCGECFEPGVYVTFYED